MIFSVCHHTHHMRVFRTHETERNFSLRFASHESRFRLDVLNSDTRISYHFCLWLLLARNTIRNHFWVRSLKVTLSDHIENHLLNRPKPVSANSKNKSLCSASGRSTSSIEYVLGNHVTASQLRHEFPSSAQLGYLALSPSCSCLGNTLPEMPNRNQHTNDCHKFKNTHSNQKSLVSSIKRSVVERFTSNWSL